MRNIQTGIHYPLPIEKLPDSWEVGYVGYFANEIQPGFASGEHNKEGEGIPHLRPMNIDRNGKLDLNVIKYVSPDKDKKRLKAGDVLFNNTNSPELVGKTTVITKDTDWGFSNHMTRIRFPNEISPKFVSYQIHFLWMSGYFLHKCLKHVNQASVSSKALADSVPLILAPPNEQKRIVAEIEKQFSRLDEATAALKRIKANLKRYKASVLKAAVEGKLTEEWRKTHPDVEPASELLKRILTERKKKWEEEYIKKYTEAHGHAPKDDSWKKKYKEPNSPDTANLPGLLKGWVWTTLSQLGELNRGKSKHRPRNAPYLYGGPYPFVQTGDVKNAKGVLRYYTQTYSDAGLKQSKLWPTGTLCITIAANIADTAILGFDACFPDSVVGFVAEPSHCNVRFVEYFIRTAKKNIERYAPATAQKNINLEILSDVAVPLPPFSEQQFIVEEVERRLSVAEEIEMQIETNIKRAERLRQSVLKKAFSGKLVPQDSNEESASKLIEKIKVSKEKLVNSDRPYRQIK